MLKMSKARITKISKDVVFSSRVIWADLTDKDGNKYHVAWSNSPSIIGVTGQWISRNKGAFERAWTSCEEGDEVWLYHSADASYNYFEPID